MPDLLTLPELAELLRISETSAYRLVVRRAIPFIKLARGLRFARGDVEAFLRQRRVDSLSNL